MFVFAGVLHILSIPAERTTQQLVTAIFLMLVRLALMRLLMLPGPALALEEKLKNKAFYGTLLEL